MKWEVADYHFAILKQEMSMVLQVFGEEEGRQKVDKGRKMQLYFVLPAKNIVVIVTLFELILKICFYLRERERETSTDLDGSSSSDIWKVVKPPALRLLPLPVVGRITLTEYMKLLSLSETLLYFGASHPSLWQNFWRIALGSFPGSPCNHKIVIKDYGAK